MKKFKGLPPTDGERKYLETGDSTDLLAAAIR
jgi:hypothetical protein